jgi:UDP-4-amino-4,6-dideoxy-N-acetyl-beta-L-altrosamine transaminase
MIDGPPFLPYGRQSIDASDHAAVGAVLDSGWLTGGPAVDKFERDLAERLGAARVISCNSGTAALHLACLALDLGPGDAAIVPTITFLATANAVRMTGAEAVFADVDPESGLITPAGLEEAIGRARAAGLRVRAVIPVHLAGQCPDMVAIGRLARAAGAEIIEDACHAIGSYHACADGSAAAVGACRHSTLATFSFHPVKTIAAGEAGAVSTNDSALADRMLRLRSHGMSRDPASFARKDAGFDAAGLANPWYYEMAEIGWNYRLSDIHAALGSSQLRRLDHFVERRRTLAQRYDEALAPHVSRVRPIRRSRGCLPAWHLYPVLIDFDRLGIERGAVMRALAAAGIGSQVHYIPVHLQPYYRRREPGLLLAGAQAYYDRVLTLPLFTEMSVGEVKRVVSTLIEILTRRSAENAVGQAATG